MKTKFNHILLILLTLLHVNSLNAAVYDADVLEIFSKLLPRFIMMSSQKEKVKDSVNICIVHNEVDKSSALILKEKIEFNYKNGIKNININIVHADYSDVHPCKNTQLSFIFNTQKDKLSHALEFLNKQKMLTVSYDPLLLQNGVGVSIFLGRRVAPYINMKSINTNKIKLDNLLLRVSKIYREGEK